MSGPVESPAQAGGPYVVKGVQPGMHAAVVYLSNRLMVRKPVMVLDGQRDLEVTVPIPAGAGVLIGDLRSDGQQAVVLIRTDGQIMGYVSSTGGAYRIEGLPSGTYWICGSVTQDKAPWITFTLAEGETKTVDIDTSKWPVDKVGLLFVQVVTPDGIPLTTSQVLVRLVRLE